jgi:hypothetical protein
MYATTLDDTGISYRYAELKAILARNAALSDRDAHEPLLIQPLRLYWDPLDERLIAAFADVTYIFKDTEPKAVHEFRRGFVTMYRAEGTILACTALPAAPLAALRASDVTPTDRPGRN